MNNQKFWIGSVSKEHVDRAKQEGFAQVCHGKEAPLKRMRENDILIYYSAYLRFSEKIPYQCLTAIGIVSNTPPYQVEMSHDFVPYRRDVSYLKTNDAPIKPLIPHLSFIQDKKRWGYPFKFGILQINRDDFICIAKSMGLVNEKIHELLI